MYFKIIESIISKISLLIRNLKRMSSRHALFKVLGGMATASAKASVEGKSASPVELILFFLVMIGFFAVLLYHARQDVGRTTFSG